MSIKRSKLFYPARVMKQILRLPRQVANVEAQNRERAEEITRLNASLTELSNELASTRENISILPSLDARLVGLQHRINTIDTSVTSKALSSVSVNNTVADNHEFDYFYKLFEDKFRGTEEAIKLRVAEHLPLFKTMPASIKKLPVVDLGCGRGEFLSLLKENRFRGIGVDMNGSMVDRAQKLGLEAEENDALTYLSKQETSSLAAVTGFHIVEHIPFEALLKIFEECYRTVSPGGFVLFETPNPAALTVGANTFYLDPSHQRPIPSQLLAFMLESVGFKPEVIPLHRVRPELRTGSKITIEMYETLYGPGDYAVVARKIH